MRAGAVDGGVEYLAVGSAGGVNGGVNGGVHELYVNGRVDGSSYNKVFRGDDVGGDLGGGST